MRLVPNTLQRYVVSEYLFSVMVSFLFFLAIFFVNQILVIARDRLAESVSIIDTLKLILYAMPAIIALSVPYSSFIGIILAVGKLSEGREILASRSSGIHTFSLLYPILIASMMLSGISFITNDYFLPLGTMKYSRLYQELLYSNSRLLIEPYAVRSYENSILITGEVVENNIRGLLILDEADDGSTRSINAAQAQLVRNDRQSGVITLQLEDVEVISFDDDEDIVQEIQAENMFYNILLEDIAVNISNPSVREMSARDVYTLMHSRREQYETRIQSETDNYLTQLRHFQLKSLAYAHMPNEVNRDELDQSFRQLPEDPRNAQGDRTLRLYRIEFWKKFSIPLASFTFIAIGFPLGLMAVRSGRTLGIVLGLVLSSGYWAMLTAIEAVGLRLYAVPAFLITFSPNILMLVFGTLLFHRYIKA